MSNRTQPRGTVYAIRLSAPLGHTEQPADGRKFQQARYYIGFTLRPIAERLAEHKLGQGSKMLAAAVAKGIELELVRVWPNMPQEWERYLKLFKNNERVINSNIRYSHAKVAPAVARYRARCMARKARRASELAAQVVAQASPADEWIPF